MSARTNADRARWHATWTQALTDVRREDEPGFENVTVRIVAPASLGGSQVRLELSNRFGDAAVRIGRAAIGIGDRCGDMTFGERSSTEIAAGETLWTDPIVFGVAHGDEITIDLFLPGPTAYTTVGGFGFSRSTPGDHAGARSFPLEGARTDGVAPSRDGAPRRAGGGGEPGGAGWSLPSGGPYLRAIEVAGTQPNAVIVALGGSATAMGWPQYASALLPAGAGIAVVNRGIAGNRIRLGAPATNPSWGRSGLERFDDDVLGTAGATHLAIAYNNNDWSLPGRTTPAEEMPSVAEVIDGYRHLIGRASAAGLKVILATVTPLGPDLLADPEREGIRTAINAWIRTSDHPVCDFDAAIRSPSDPSRLAAEYAAPDEAHPNINGQKRLAQAMVETIDQAKRPVEDKAK